MFGNFVRATNDANHYAMLPTKRLWQCCMAVKVTVGLAVQWPSVTDCGKLECTVCEGNSCLVMLDKEAVTWKITDHSLSSACH